MKRLPRKLADAKPVANPIIPEIIGEIISTGKAAEALGVSDVTVVRRIKRYMGDPTDPAGLKGFVIGCTKNGRPIYGTTAYYCRTHWQRMQKRMEQ